MVRIVRIVRFATVALLVLGAAVANATAQASEPRPAVIVYGDSLVHEAASYVHRLVREVAGADAKVLGAPGGAPCDVLDEMQRDAARHRPAAVVLGFSGNALTACMEDERGRPLRGDAWLAKYRADVVAAIDALRPTAARVWLATAPISLHAERNGEDDVHRLATLYREIAASLAHVEVAEAARAVLDERDRWTLTLPCLPNELCTGGVDTRGRRVNQVRAPDGAHFCPVPYPGMASCPTHASGALRYALGMVVPALQGSGLFDQARFDASIGGGWRPR
jgi:hypothetical protein